MKHLLGLAALGLLGLSSSAVTGTILEGPRLHTVPVSSSSTEGLLITEEAPTTANGRALALTSWSPTVEEALAAEAAVHPRLLARLRIFHPDWLPLVSSAKRHYLGVRDQGADALLVVGFRPDSAFVRRGLWARPLIVSAPNPDVLFMAWVPRVPTTSQPLRLWPHGKALEYPELIGLLPSAWSAAGTAARDAARRHFWFRTLSCNPPNPEQVENSTLRFVGRVSFSCSLLAEDGSRPQRGLETSATFTIASANGRWAIADVIPKTFSVLPR